MCHDCVAPPVGLTRRRFLTAGGAVVTSVLAPPGTVAAGPRRTLGPQILPRDRWGADLPPTGPIEAEPDVRFLLVHHTVTANDYAADDVPGIIRGFHAFHTGPDKGWPDVAYNFLIDRFGRIWEARSGSLDGAVRGSATGGNQGFDQKCSFIGDHTAEAPSPEARAAMVALLAWLADRHDIATAPRSMTTFSSLGSNRHPAGKTVTTATIEGHRAMSTTACPGDAAYRWLTDVVPSAVTEIRSATSTTTTSSTTTASTTTAAPIPSSSTTEAAVTAGDRARSGPGSDLPSLAVGGGALAAVVGGLALLARRRRVG